MEFLIVLLIVVIILGALLGGKSLGGTVRIGCGFLLLLIVIAVVIGAILYTTSESNSNNSPNNRQEISPTNAKAYFVVKEDCQTYSKPDINSDISGNLEEGEEIFVENVNKYDHKNGQRTTNNEQR